MKTLANKEITEFNDSKKNKRLLTQATSYAFISCPDFSHENGTYTYRSVNDEIPLSLSLAKSYLQDLDKEVVILVSDHEAYRPEVLTHLRLTFEEMHQRISLSVQRIQTEFPTASLLSSLYPYQNVLELKANVPKDYQMERAIIFGDEGKTVQEREQSYREKYAQMYTFLAWCKDNQSCAVLLYSKFTFNLATVIRNQIQVPLLFLDANDPH